jgi:hypothetical protein
VTGVSGVEIRLTGPRADVEALAGALARHGQRLGLAVVEASGWYPNRPRRARAGGGCGDQPAGVGRVYLHTHPAPALTPAPARVAAATPALTPTTVTAGAPPAVAGPAGGVLVDLDAHRAEAQGPGWVACGCGSAWFTTAVALDPTGRVTGYAAPLVCAECGIPLDPSAVRP